MRRGEAFSPWYGPEWDERSRARCWVSRRRGRDDLKRFESRAGPPVEGGVLDIAREMSGAKALQRGVCLGHRRRRRARIGRRTSCRGAVSRCHGAALVKLHAMGLKSLLAAGAAVVFVVFVGVVVGCWQGFGGHTLECQAFVNADSGDSKASRGALAAFRRYVWSSCGRCASARVVALAPFPA